MRTMPSTIEYSLCSLRCTKVTEEAEAGARMGYNFTRFRPIRFDIPMPTSTCTIVRNALMLAALVLAACSTAPVTPPPPPAAPSAPAPTEPPPTPPPAKPQTPPTTHPDPPSNVNLQGFPLAYRQGYADGCASVGATEQKDAARFKNDSQYRTGWQDGVYLCKKK
jgi:hypothetical protein